MKRLIILLLLSVFSFGIYAQYAESSYSIISHRQYGAQSDSYHSSHHNIVDYQDRVSANTFSSTPSMEITTMLSPEPDHNNNSNMAEPAGIRPPQRGVGEGDEKPEEGWEEPFPLGDTPWMLITLLALGYALRKRAILRKEITD